VRAFLDGGGTWLICTLRKGHNGRHYDDAFCIPWKEFEKTGETDR